MSDKERVLEAPEGAPYKFLWCDIRGEYRCSLVCGKVCANNSWCSSKSGKVRSKCKSWKQLKKEENND